MAIRARWVGGTAEDNPNFEYFAHIPARDLEDEEFDALPEEDQELVSHTERMWEMVTPQEARAEQREARRAERAERSGGGDE